LPKKALNSPELYETIVKHRYRFTRLSGVNYNLHQPQSINPIPPVDFIEACEADYKTMQEQMIYGDSPKFIDMIQVIHEFIAKLNGLAWKMESKFKIHIADSPIANAEGDIA